MRVCGQVKRRTVNYGEKTAVPADYASRILELRGWVCPRAWGLEYFCLPLGKTTGSAYPINLEDDRRDGAPGFWSAGRVAEPDAAFAGDRRQARVRGWEVGD